jgi:hypothetical protein
MDPRAIAEEAVLAWSQLALRAVDAEKHSNDEPQLSLYQRALLVLLSSLIL